MSGIFSLAGGAASERRTAGLRLGLLLVLTCLAFLTERAEAQLVGDGFLLRPPVATVTFSGGFARPDAASDVFTFNFDELTLARRDLSGPAFAVELAIRRSSRLDVTLGAGITTARSDSEFRDWVDQNDRPIEQTTEFRRIPITAGVRYYIIPRDKMIGSFAWFPARLAPYLGAGGGLVWYRFSQEGDFVDYQTLDIFTDRYNSEGWAPTVHLLAGLDFSLGLRWALNLEGRYSRAKKGLGEEFEGFEPIDLSGLTTSIGFQYRIVGALR